MYKIAFALIAVMLFAACHDDGIGMEWDAGQNPSVSEEQPMEELTVSWNGNYAEALAWQEKTVTLNAGRLISITIKSYVDEENKVEDCSDSAELEEADYQNILTYVTNADLLNYTPPQECEVDILMRNITVVYGVEGGEGNEFNTGECPYESVIQDIVNVVNDVAVKYMPDCTERPLGSVEENNESKEVE